MDVDPRQNEDSRDRALIDAAREAARRLRDSGSIPAAELAPLPKLPGYRIEGELHRGGQGVVYRARRLVDDARVAIKIIPRRADDRGSRFEREVELLRQLDHPSIVALDDWGSTGDGRYLVMELVDGLPLDEYVDLGPIEPEETIEVFVTVCEAVHAAHLRGVIHRDLKPSNILVRSDGHPVVLDFGLAKSIAPTQTELTATGLFVGSLPWTSPEQATSDDRVDLRSDIYSLGVLLYRCLAGRPPYSTDGPIRETLEHILHTEPTPLSHVAPGIGDDLATVVATALQKEPERRYQSAADLAQELRRCLNREPIQARRENALLVMRRRLERHRWVTILGSALVVVSIASTAAVTLLYREQDRLRRAAELEAREARTIQRFLESIFTSIETAPHRSEAVTVSELVDDATERLTAAGLAPEVEASLRTTLGRSLLWIGRSAQARDELRRAVELAPDASTPGPRCVQQYHLLGLAHQQLGEYDDAEHWFELAVHTTDRLPDSDPSERVALLRSYALFELARDRYPSCVVLLDRADEAAARLDPLADLRVRLLLDRGQLYMRQAQLGPCEAAFRRAHEAARQRVESIGDSGLDLLHSAGNHLGTILIELGRSEEAESLLKAALDYREECWGPIHDQTLQTRHALSILYSRTGRLDRAAVLAEETSVGFAQRYGPDHPRALHVRMNLARILEQQEDPRAAELYAETYDRLRAILGDANLTTAICGEGVARAWSREGRDEEVEPILRRVHDAYRIGGPGVHADRLRAGDNWALALRRLGRLEESATVLRELIAAEEAVSPRSEMSGRLALKLERLQRELDGHSDSTTGGR
ncbi:MAG: protein kinase [Planctomycetes bacterium]|nr:protein kinase [Planctomycetota bacterium]